MSDTNHHVEVLRAVRSVFDHIPLPCQERDALDAAITALSARASAGEGGEWVMVPRRLTAENGAPAICEGGVMRVLNLYSGLGGNRKLWTGVDVTAVELDERIAAVYQRLHPQDTVVVGDAHQYLLDHSDRFDFIWSSPPCQTHSKMAKATRHKHLRRYADMSLYQEILHLTHFFKGKWVVENVVPYYAPLIPGKRLGRHMYWANFDVGDYQEPIPKDFINLANVAGKHRLMEWLGIYYEENIYYGGNHCPAQILRNCVHPNEGLSIIKNAIADYELEVAA